MLEGGEGDQIGGSRIYAVGGLTRHCLWGEGIKAVVVGNGLDEGPRLYGEMDRSDVRKMGRGEGDRERAGGRKEREKGRGKKLGRTGCRAARYK